jgi:uncharacterized protein YgiM (DUF1202 family)
MKSILIIVLIAFSTTMFGQTDEYNRGLGYYDWVLKNDPVYNSKAWMYTSYPRYYVNTSSANLRTGGDVNAPILCNMVKGEYVRVISYYNNGWWQVYYMVGDRVGYVKSSLLKSDPD